MTNKKIKIWNNKFKDIIKNGGRNMKKFITLTLSFLLLFSMTACGNRATTNNNAQGPANPADNNAYFRAIKI